jgi:hypothetical protein
MMKTSHRLDRSAEGGFSMKTSVLKSLYEKMRRSNSRPTPGMQRECSAGLNAGLASTPPVSSGVGPAIRCAWPPESMRQECGACPCAVCSKGGASREVPDGILSPRARRNITRIQGRVF